MKVILRSDVKGTGKAGDLCDVSNGYARNYLFPKNLAIEANTAAMNEYKNRQDSIKFQKDMELQKAAETAKSLEGSTFNISAKAGTSGRLFGAVTTKEIASIIANEKKIEVDRRKIVLDKDIKAYGEYTVEIKLHSNITATVTVVVGE